MLRIAGMFLFCNIAWVFFRAESLGQVIYILRKSLYGIEHPIVYLKQGQVDLQFDVYMCIRVLFLMITLTIFDYMNQSGDVLEVISRQRIWIRWTLYVLFAFAILMFLPVKQAQEFIYFQF